MIYPVSLIKMILGSRSSAIAYLPNLRSAVAYIRKFASSTSSTISERRSRNDTDRQSYDDSLVWPDRELGPLSDRDPRFPLPGLVGVPPSIIHTPPHRINPEILFETSIPCERHASILNQTLVHLHSIEPSQAAGETEDTLSAQPTPDTMLECVAHDCPVLLRKDFRDLFPTRDLLMGDLTVITLCLHTTNDMCGWSLEIETERNNLIVLFMSGAQDICRSLSSAGFWADFIDPASGRPFYGSYTNATLFETDERFRKLGFEIKDLGCCKVISHHIWGTQAFVGCLFTDAPLHHDIVSQLRLKTS